MNYYGKNIKKNADGLPIVRHIIGTLIGIVSFFILISICAFMLSSLRLSDNLIPLLLAISLGIASLLGGFFSSRLVGSKGLKCGLITGASYILLHLIMCLIFGGFGNGGALVFLYFGVEAAFSALGGIIGINTKR